MARVLPDSCPNRLLKKSFRGLFQRVAPRYMPAAYSENQTLACSVSSGASLRRLSSVFFNTLLTVCHDVVQALEVVDHTPLATAGLHPFAPRLQTIHVLPRVDVVTVKLGDVQGHNIDAV